MVDQCLKCDRTYSQHHDLNGRFTECHDEEIVRLRDRIYELENTLRDIYAMRGEDEYIAKRLAECGL